LTCLETKLVVSLNRGTFAGFVENENIMAQLCSLLKSFQPSAMAEIFTLAGQSKDVGHDVIDLS